jgi:hypothetical protein
VRGDEEMMVLEASDAREQRERLSLNNKLTCVVAYGQYSVTECKEACLANMWVADDSVPPMLT